MEEKKGVESLSRAMGNLRLPDVNAMEWKQKELRGEDQVCVGEGGSVILVLCRPETQLSTYYLQTQKNINLFN